MAEQDFMRHLGSIGYEKVRAAQRQNMMKRGRLRKKDVEALLRDLEQVFDAIKNHGVPGYSGIYGNPYSGVDEFLRSKGIMPDLTGKIVKVEK